MAKTVGDLLIKLGVDGIEGVTQLKSALSGLSKAAGPADAGLIKLGKAIKAFNREGGASRDVIAGKLSALKSLRNQAGLNGAAFRALTKDIVDYQQKLAAADKQIDETTRKVSTLAQVSSQIPGRKAGTFGSQIAAFNEELKELSVTSDRYATVLRNIQERTRSFQRAQARQGVIAAGRTGAEGPADPRTAFQVTTQLPRTTAALSLRLTELREDFANIAIGSKDYVNALREINSLESQIGDPFGTAARKQQIRGRLGQQEQFGMFAPRDPVQSAIARRERRRSRRYGGFAGGGMANQPAEATGLFRTIASIGSSEAKAATEMMGRSLSQVTAEINRQAAASNGSINSLQAQRTAFAQLRAGLDPTSQDFRELGVQIEKVDRRLEKLTKRRRRFSAKGFASALGGVAAGGIFGGPEGAIGGAIGGVVGGLPGVAAGATIGAQAKMLREMLGATSDYAAQLKKLEIALEGVTKVDNDPSASLANFRAGLKAAADVSDDFNVPLDVSTKGITKLAAAVIGAEGNIHDAELVFRNITAAIKATGGGAQDVESAITAMVQTFSKGKVSAEELSGQLGERLPGAVTQFAKANNMTLPQLQKAFKAGTVGLNELMEFIKSLGPEYAETAAQIANSSADAGAKAQVAFDKVRREVGESLQPIGASLQKAFAEFVTDILPAIKGAAQGAAAGMKALLDVSSVLLGSFKEILIVAGVSGIVLIFQNLITVAGGLGTVYAILTAKVVALNAAMFANPFLLVAAGITAATVALIKLNNRQKEYNSSVIKGETPVKDAQDRLDGLNERMKELKDRMEGTTNNRLLQSLRKQLRLAKTAAKDLELAIQIATPYTVSGITYDPVTGAAINAPMSYEHTKFASPKPDGADGGKDISFEMAQARINAMREVVTLADVEAKLANDLLQISLDDLKTNEELVAKAQAHNDAENARLQIEKQLRDLQTSLQEQLDKALLATGEITQEEFNQNELARRRIELEAQYLPLLLDGKKTREEILEIIEKILKGEAEGQKKTKSFVEGLKELIKESTNLNDILADYGVQAIDKFADAFADFVATGKLKFKEFAASVLSDLSRIFIRAAFFNALTAAFPSLKPSANGNAFAGSGVVPYAKGGIVSKPTMFQYADGASGSFGLMGEAGAEAIMPLKRGPSGRLGVEVTNQGSARDAMNRYSRRSAGAAGGGVVSEDEAIAAVQGSSAAIDVRYSVERINNVDYVTADQFQQGLQQAAAQGAQRGEQQTLRRLQMSSSTRRRIGV